MTTQTDISRIAADLTHLGVKQGGVLLMHSSLSSMGHVQGGPETVILGLLKALGSEGTLLLPALSYETVTRRQANFDVRHTPSCIGAIPEYFRTRPGTLRSMHPTHSVCGVGKRAEELLADHHLDTTPVGPHSPFSLLPKAGGQILMLGCGLKPNTSMHGIEELSRPPYLFSNPINYTLIDYNGKSTAKVYIPHSFRGWDQRYDRIADYMDAPALRTGKVLKATAYLIDAETLWSTAHKIYLSNPLAFVAEKQAYTN